MMETAHDRKQESKQSGIALIVVLGMLSVLVLMGVAFAISMRTERLASGSYVDVVRARHLADAALADLMANRLRTSMDGRLYPDFEVIGGGAAGGAEGLLAGNHSIRYVHGSLRVEALAQDRMDWIDIRDPDGRFMGQYAFIMLNNSGFADANVIGGRERRDGNHPAELVFNNNAFPEASDETLETYRQELVRFETLPELFELTSLETIAGINPPLVRDTTARVRFLNTFSRFPMGYGLEDAGGTVERSQISIAGNPDTDWDEAAIRQVLLQEPLLPIPNVDAFIDMLYDYATPSFQPRALQQNRQGMGFKRVPMINEIVVSNRLERILVGATESVDDELVLELHVAVETYFPFPQPPDTETFSIHMDMPTLTVGPAGYSALATLNPATPNPATFTHNEFDYRVTRFVFRSDPIVPTAWARNMGVRPTLPAINVRRGALPVNRVWPNWRDDAFDAIFRDVDTMPAGELEPNRTYSYSVNDPRLNWDPDPDAGQWSAVAATLGAQNDPAVMSGNADEMFFMFCAQRPFTNVGEVAYLLYDADKPWTTVRLLGPDPDESARIIDRFTLSTNDVQRGLVNVNTSHNPPLMSAFLRAPLSPNPTLDPTVPRVSQAQAQGLANLVRTRINAINTGGIRNLSDLATLINGNDIHSIIGGDNNKFRNESVIRNSLGLFGTRQNLFTVILAVRTFPQGVGPGENIPAGLTLDDMVMSEQRAVALIWRDPFLTGTGATQSHETFVRFFTWLSME